jgi:hypothetical protein
VPDRGEGTSSSPSGDTTGDVGDCVEELDATRLAVAEPARVLAGLESLLSPLIPSRDANAPADARGLSVALSGFVAEPGIFDRIEPLRDRDEPCVSDLVKDG